MRIPWKAKSMVFALMERTGSIDKVLPFLQQRVTRRAHRPLVALPDTWKFHGSNLRDNPPKRLIEIGAGRDLGQNLYFYGLGVETQYLLDLKPLLNFALLEESLAKLRDLNPTLARPLPKKIEGQEDLQALGIHYLAPSDARATGFSDNFFDAKTSTNTFEHIPFPVLEQIMREMRRILRPGALLSLKIDYSDHYSHTDPSISKINYLRFSEKEWQRYNHADHYQNRRRHQDYHSLFARLGFRITWEEALYPMDPPPRIDPAFDSSADQTYRITGRFLLVNEK